MRTLASPLEHVSVDEWRARVNEECKTLLGADSVGFLMPGVDGLAMYSRDHDASELNRYPEVAVPSLENGESIWGAVLAMQAGTLAQAYGSQYRRAYLASAYYNEYARPNGATTCALMTTTMDPGSPDQSVASIQLWRASRHGSQFSDRQIALMRLLYPAFEAGARAQHQFGRQRANVVSLLEGLGSAVALFDARGRELHRTASFQNLLAADAGGAQSVLWSVRAIVEALRATLSSDTGQGALGQALSRELATATANYRLNGLLHRCTASQGEPVLLVSLERAHFPISEDSLKRTYRLTPAESRVALLLREGFRNDEIASSLSLSSHTIRRHTEAVLIKLGVTSRAKAAVLLRG